MRGSCFFCLLFGPFGPRLARGPKPVSARQLRAASRARPRRQTASRPLRALHSPLGRFPAASLLPAPGGSHGDGACWGLTLRAVRLCASRSRARAAAARKCAAARPSHAAACAKPHQAGIPMTAARLTHAAPQQLKMRSALRVGSALGLVLCSSLLQVSLAGVYNSPTAGHNINTDDTATHHPCAPVWISRWFMLALTCCAIRSASRRCMNSFDGTDTSATEIDGAHIQGCGASRPSPLRARRALLACGSIVARQRR